MLGSANNFYRMTTATSVANSGLGNNPLTKPAGVEVASIVPDRKYSVHVPSAVQFTTDFDIDVDGYTILFYAKPEPGVVLSLAGVVVEYTGHSLTITNEIGDKAEIPTGSPRAHLIIYTHSDNESELYVDGKSVQIPDSTPVDLGPAAVTLLAAGGIIEYVSGYGTALSTGDIVELTTNYLEPHTPSTDTSFMNDNSREHVGKRTVVESITLADGEVKEILLRANECIAFKVEYLLTGDADVFINGELFESGMGLVGMPEDVTIASRGCTVSDLVITEYYSPTLMNAGLATVSTDMASGNIIPTHVHDDAAANHGDTTITLVEPAGSISGWFYATDGAPMPGVTMSNSVLTGTDLFVNGKPYSTGVVKDWYFLSRNATFNGIAVIDVPVHSLTVSTNPLTADQVDDLYESFFGNPKASAGVETIGISELPAFIISTEWSIVASG